MKRFHKPPQAAGLYDPSYEHDACGVAFVARLDNEPTHEVVELGLRALENLEHRGATGADPLTGDGAGILLQLPDELFRGLYGDALPPCGQYGVAVCFLPREDAARAAKLERLLADAVEAEGQRVVAWREIEHDLAHVGETASSAAPLVKQLVVGASPEFAADELL